MTSFEGNSFLGLINRLRGAFYHRDDSTMTVEGLRTAYAGKTADYTALASDFLITVFPTVADITITLPDAAEFGGQVYVIKRVGGTAYNVTIDASGSQTIDGALTYSLPSLWDSVIIECNSATTWRVLARGGAGSSSPYVAKTANYTLTAYDGTVECTANSFTLTLPTAVGAIGRVYNLKNSGNGIITIATTSSQTIDGNASGVLKLSQYDNLTVQSTGAAWIIL